jgi:uncharacterized protein with FMN-binding domain
MRRITLAILSTLAVLVLLLSYRTSLGGGVAAQPAEQATVLSGGGTTTTGQGPDPTAGSDSSGSSAPGSSGSSGLSGSSDAGSSSSGDSSSAPTAPAATDTVVDGSAEMTRYGAVQVRVTISGGRITDVTAIQYPTAERRDQEINSYALPQLRTEVLSAQSAQVDVVSGATFTTEGYLASLQSALDAAHFSA